MNQLEEELYNARKNFALHMSGRIHLKYGRTPDTTNCPKCLRTLIRIAEAERAVEREGHPVDPDTIRAIRARKDRP